MKTEDVLKEFKEAGALLNGHFILSSGLHSPVFLQKALVFKNPARAARLCHALAGLIKDKFGKIDVVVSPALGGILPGYEVARALGAEAMFVEREQGVFRLRRGFHIPPGARIVMVEDIVTTGLSSRECLTCLKNLGAPALAAASLVDRSGGRADLGVPFITLACVDFPAYAPEDLPEELAALPPEKPGSRTLV